MRLDELWIDAGDDDAVMWAKQHEFLLRRRRYRMHTFAERSTAASQKMVDALRALTDTLRKYGWVR